VRGRGALVALLALQGGVLLVAVLVIGVYGWDDGAITLAFSRTFAESGRIALTPVSDPVEGFSSVSWFLLNALVAVARPGFAGAILASQLLTLMTLVGSGLALDRLGRGMGIGDLARWGALGTFALMGPLFSETVNGMEMGLLTLSALLIVHGLYFDPHRRLAGLALTVFVATRFEAAFYLAFLLAPLLAEKRTREFVRWASVGAAVFVAIAVLRWILFDALLPNTIYAKMHAPYHLEGAPALRSRIEASHEILRMFVPALIVLAARAAWLRAGRRTLGRLARDYALWAPIAAAVSFALITGTNWGYVGRMQLFALPFVLLLVARVVDALAGPTRTMGVALVVSVAALTLWSSRVSLPIQSYRLSRSREFGVTPMGFSETALAVEKVRTALGLPRITFLTPDIGGSALCCPSLRIVDLGLLAEPRLARAGYGALDGVLEVERPEVIEVHAPWGALSGLYELDAYRTYRPALIDRTRFYLRSDVADQLVTEGRAETLLVTRGRGTSTLPRDHRYAGYTAPIDDEAFASRGGVLLVR
jgi:hypothetical protein